MSDYPSDRDELHPRSDRGGGVNLGTRKGRVPGESGDPERTIPRCRHVKYESGNERDRLRRQTDADAKDSQ